MIEPSNSVTQETTKKDTLGDVQVVVTGDVLCDTQFLRGYNTFYRSKDGNLSTRLNHEAIAGATIVAGVCGVVDVVEKVVSIRGLAPRYIPEIGDVVVGRIIEVSGKRWRCELGGLHDGVMLLSNVTQPGGLLRRRGRGDELTMRKIFTESDVFVAEVQRVTPDGIASLHTRSAEKFGKLSGIGQVASVRPSLVRRVKRHFHTFRNLCVSVVLGVNGTIWIGKATPEQMDEALAEEESLLKDEDRDDMQESADQFSTASLSTVDPTDETEVRQAVARVGNILKVLSNNQLAIYPRAISAAVEFSVTRQMTSFGVLSPENAQLIAVDAASRRPTQYRKRDRMNM